MFAFKVGTLQIEIAKYEPKIAEMLGWSNCRDTDPVPSIWAYTPPERRTEVQACGERASYQDSPLRRAARENVVTTEPDCGLQHALAHSRKCRISPSIMLWRSAAK